MRVLYGCDGDLSVIRRKVVAIIGYGSQGKSHALNLRDSGVEVIVGLRSGKSKDQAESDGFRVEEVEVAVQLSDVVMMLVPDEIMGGVHNSHIKNLIRPGSVLAFAHGFNVHYNQIIPSSEVDVIMVAPKAPGPMVRETYLKGQGVPHLIAVWQDCTGEAKDIALSYAIANGGGYAGIIETTFKDETETDLFGEQAVLCGGLIELVKSGFDVLVENNYEPELAYFECLHELKLIVDLLYQKGISGVNEAISNNAEFGEYVSGPKVIGEGVKAAMSQVLRNIQSGKYARDFLLEKQTNTPIISTKRKINDCLLIELVGRELRNKMGWMRT
ncbi:ketol-acid reductoisomerase [Candidatus Tremblaya phenacola PAVE]|nr:ketol-acid reductoisomerase [Candidatus Tremblaya phenacola PAVE]